MKRKSHGKRGNYTSRHQQTEWLPIDSRLIPDIISFSHVKGIARIFLLIEIILSVLVVSGSLGLAVFTFLFK